MTLIKKILIFLVSMATAMASASNVGVWPINPRIDSPTSSTLLWVKNNNKNDPVVLQARVFLWKQIDNKDQLEAQDDLVISPPIIEVKPDMQQIFRVMNRKGAIANASVEQTYRILIDEVPKEDSAQGSELRFQMRYSLPLFVGRPAPYNDKTIVDVLKNMANYLSYRIVQEPSPAIEIINKGPLHARLSNLTVRHNSLPENKLQISDGLLGYVLPNSAKRWPLDKTQLAAISLAGAQVTFEQEHQELGVAAEK